MSASLYSPSPVQQEFHLCDADEALLGGSGGPGKSLALLMDPIQTQLISEHQRWVRREIAESEGKAIHFRREFPMLGETLDRAHRIFPKIDPKVHWDGETRTFRFQCGYKYQFAHLKDAKDWAIYDSNQYAHLGFDEAWQFEEEQYRRLVRRCRVSDPVLRKQKRVRCASIPSGNWLRAYFVEPEPRGRKLLQTRIKMDDGSPDVIRSRIFIPALLRDNPDPEFRRDYEANLKDSPPHIRRALLDGDWYAVAGAFFAAEFIYGVHAIEPFKVPAGWTRFRSADWGYKNPTVVLWWAVDQDENLLCYRERTYIHKDAAEVAEEIRREELAADEWDRKKDCSKLTGPIDTQVWEQRGTIGPTMAETFSDKGVWWEKCTKNRLASVQQFMRRLKDRTGEKQIPAIRFFNTCVNTLRTVPAIATDPLNAELPKDGGEDHWLDAVLYACMYRLIAAKSDDGPMSGDHDDELGERRRTARWRNRNGGKFGYGGW